MDEFKLSIPLESAKSVGRRIALLRNEKGLTQAQLSEKLNISRSLIASIESGQKMPDLELWTALALFFGVSTDYIAGTSTSRAYKSFSGCVKIDLERLNDKGKSLMYKFYTCLLDDPEYTSGE